MRGKLQVDLRNMQADMDTLREQLEEEQDAKSIVQRQLAKALGEAQQWKTRFESGEGAAGGDVDEMK